MNWADDPWLPFGLADWVMLPLTVALLVSVPARMARFLLVTLLASWLAHGAFPDWPPATKLAAWFAAWCLFYAWYFRAVRRREA